MKKDIEFNISRTDNGFLVNIITQNYSSKKEVYLTEETLIKRIKEFFKEGY